MSQDQSGSSSDANGPAPQLRRRAAHELGTHVRGPRTRAHHGQWEPSEIGTAAAGATLARDGTESSESGPKLTRLGACYGWSSVDSGSGPAVQNPICVTQKFTYPTDRVTVAVDNGG
jgi:hypothetical protein